MACYSYHYKEAGGFIGAISIIAQNNITFIEVDMLSRMNGSKQLAIISSIILMAFLAGACGPILPEQGRNATATNAPTFTAIPPTVTLTSKPDVVYVTDVPT